MQPFKSQNESNNTTLNMSAPCSVFMDLTCVRLCQFMLLAFRHHWLRPSGQALCFWITNTHWTMYIPCVLNQVSLLYMFCPKRYHSYLILNVMHHCIAAGIVNSNSNQISKVCILIKGMLAYIQKWLYALRGSSPARCNNGTWQCDTVQKKRIQYHTIRCKEIK